MQLPIFKYNPDPIKLEAILKRETLCPVCKKTRDYVYEGPFFSEDDVEGICPWCIADGSAAEKYEGEFQDKASCEDVEVEEYVEELIYRTPGYVGWQQEYWLSHCGDFCSIKSYVGWKEIKHLENELVDDIKKICEDYNISFPEFKESLIQDGDFQGYLFQCNSCKKHRLHADMS